jgi:hypothetical protein
VLQRPTRVRPPGKSVSARGDATGRVGDTIMRTNSSSGQRFIAFVTATGPVVQLQ